MSSPDEAEQHLPWLAITPDGDLDLARTAELAVIEQLLQHPSGFHRSAPGDAVIGVGNGETEFAVLADRGHGRFQERQRGAVNETLTASSVLVALRYLTGRVASLTRPSWWPSVNPAALAPGVTLESVEGGQRLSWGEHWLLLPRHSDLGSGARTFSWTLRAPPEAVAAGYLHFSGTPLFPLDLPPHPPPYVRVAPLSEPHRISLPTVRRPDRHVLERPDPDELLDKLLGESRLLHWAPEDGGLIEVGNDQHSYIVLRDDAGSVRLDTVDRGVRGTIGQFSDQGAAYAYLVLILAEAMRTRQGWPPIPHRRLASRAELADGADHRRLTWPGGWADLAPGWLGEQHAHRFSWAAQVRPAEIVDSYGHRNGEPLFDLGLRHRPEPPPVEPPPPDPTAAADTDAVLAAAAEIDWVSWPTAAGDVLVVADQSGTGRAISHRHGMFQYQSVVGDWRKIKATFTTADAARRFLVMEVSTIARSWRRQPVLRVRRAAPGWTVGKDPTEFVVAGPGVTATFPLGLIGRQHASTFTWCGTAGLDEIVASFRHPEGTPLFPQPS